MDRYGLLALIIAIGMCLAFVLLVVPALGFVMHWIICDLCGCSMDDMLYWTGIGLVGVLSLTIGLTIKDRNE